ncbi:hypothetical protein [Nocardia transvalensis]|uniref:hypothetical protein n=1 Tax=Nocardia transvalensis TaxID=37333 RepID=UPI001895D399|nr:hypothetical protein [Nocardia transvalensis]MBF6333350.1 hypothetical protein [Nocardia transvalensis]
MTAQTRYYALLGRCEREGDHVTAAVLRAQGPPAPEPPDGLCGAIDYARHRAAHGDEDATRFLLQHTFTAHHRLRRPYRG